MSSQKKKGMNLERKQNLTGWAFLMPATILIAWMSFYPMIHQPEIQRICKLCPYFKRPDL